MAFSLIKYWPLLAISAALFDSGVHLLTKRSLAKVDEYVMSIALCFGAAAVCFVFLCLGELTQSGGFPSVELWFWGLLFAVSVIAGLGLVMFMRALKESDVSLCIPLLCLSPLFAMGWGALLISEYPSVIGLLGVFVVLVGAYSLELGSIERGMLGPVYALFKYNAARLMLITTLCWSFTSVLDKIGVLHASPLFWTFSVSLGLGLVILAYALVFKKISWSDLFPSNKSLLMAVGVCYACMHLSQMSALVGGQVPYVLSIKRLAILFSVVLGGLLFREQHLRQRTVSAVIMLAGVVMIALFTE